MRFPGRDLKAYAEPVTPERLVVGEVYFSVQYVDQDLLAPVVEALVFLGNNLDPGPEGIGHYFQDAGAFLAGARYGSSDEEVGVIYHQPEGQIKHIFEFEHALDELLNCSLRRAASPEVRYRPIKPGHSAKGRS